MLCTMNCPSARALCLQLDSHGPTCRLGATQAHSSDWKTRGLWAAHFTLPARELFLTLPSCFATLQKSDPLKVYPQLQGSFLENLKHLKNTMESLDWKVSRFPCTQDPSLMSILGKAGRRGLKGRLGHYSQEAMGACLPEEYSRKNAWCQKPPTAFKTLGAQLCAWPPGTPCFPGTKPGGAGAW